MPPLSKREAIFAPPVPLCISPANARHAAATERPKIVPYSASPLDCRSTGGRSMIAPTVCRRRHTVAAGVRSAGHAVFRRGSDCSASCRERRLGAPHAPQAHNPLRLALLDTSLKEGGYFCTAGPPANTRRNAATASMYACPTVRRHWHARHAAATERPKGAGVRWTPPPQAEAPTDAAAENVPYSASPLDCRSTGGRSMIAPTVCRRQHAVAAGVCMARIHPCRPRGISPRLGLQRIV